MKRLADIKGTCDLCRLGTKYFWNDSDSNGLQAYEAYILQLHLGEGKLEHEACGKEATYASETWKRGFALGLQD